MKTKILLILTACLCRLSHLFAQQHINESLPDAIHEDWFPSASINYITKLEYVLHSSGKESLRAINPANRIGFSINQSATPPAN